MGDAPECMHIAVSLIYAPPGGGWACDSCGQQFQPTAPPGQEYKAGLLAGREEGALHMRAAVERYLFSQNIFHPQLPRTMGERRALEKEWDRQVDEAAARKETKS